MKAVPGFPVFIVTVPRLCIAWSMLLVNTKLCQCASQMGSKQRKTASQVKLMYCVALDIDIGIGSAVREVIVIAIGLTRYITACISVR